MSIKNPFYQHLSLSQMGNPISGRHVVWKDVVFHVGLDLCDPCIGTLGGLHGTRTIGTASFEVLVSPPSLGLAAQAVGCRSRLSNTPSRTGAKVEALADRSSATAFSAWGM
jgi:hypothetical protein